MLESNHNKNFLFKYEAANPTGSFKDRGSTVEITKARELGVKKVVCASTGNMGASVASYSARANINCTIYLPTFTPPNKANQIKNMGANIVNVKGTYEDAVKLTKTQRAKKHVYLTGDYAYRGEGEKSVAFEIIDQLNWNPPDIIALPVGNATLLASTCKALFELKEVGLIKKIPRVAAIQAKGCNPLYKAYKNKCDHITTCKSPKTIATAIACGHPVDATQALSRLRKMRGITEQVTEREIIQARKELGKQGIFVEPSGAVSYAGAKKLELGKRGQQVVCILSGHGLKDPRVL